MRHFQITRRQTLRGLGVAFAYAALGRPADALGYLDTDEFGLTGGSQSDQTAAMQAAIDAATDRGLSLLLPSGIFYVTELKLRGGTRLLGVPGGTNLSGLADGPVARATSIGHLIVEGVAFNGRVADGVSAGLVTLEDSSDVTFRSCSFSGPATGILARSASATIEDCVFAGMGDAAIHAANSTGMMIRGNRISECGNAGVRIWRDEPGPDRSIVTGNRISRIDWVGGGNGQNGNGVNVYHADEVIVADNVISDCAFTAVRVNGGRNSQIRGNTCTNSGEVAIFSEFEFSGSVVADNIIDGAATGIDITNLDSGGHLATCTGNIVRNIYPKSQVNPDTVPVGIYAEADTVVANNVIENVPGVGIAAGYGPFVRNVSISSNVITGASIGIGVTVVNDPKVGAVHVGDNLISGASTAGIAGLEWEKIVTDDLARDAANYPHLTVSDNTIA